MIFNYLYGKKNQNTTHNEKDNHNNSIDAVLGSCRHC